MRMTFYLLAAVFVILLLSLAVLVGCHGERTKPFLEVECVGDEVLITLRVPWKYEGTLTVDDVVIPAADQASWTYGEHLSILLKEYLTPGLHTAELHCRFVGPEYEHFPGYREHGEEFRVSVDFEVPGPEIVAKYYLCPIDGAESPPPYLLRLDGFFTGDHRDAVTFSAYDACLTTFDDGTATIDGVVRVVEGGSGYYDLSVNMVATSGSGGYDYYEITDGLLVDGDDVTKLVGYGPPAQIGFGANGKNGNFGFSGWVNYERSNGIGNLDVHWPASDFLGDLSEDSCEISLSAQHAGW